MRVEKRRAFSATYSFKLERASLSLVYLKDEFQDGMFVVLCSRLFSSSLTIILTLNIFAVIRAKGLNCTGLIKTCLHLYKALMAYPRLLKLRFCSLSENPSFLFVYILFTFFFALSNCCCCCSGSASLLVAKKHHHILSGVI